MKKVGKHSASYLMFEDRAVMGIKVWVMPGICRGVMETIVIDNITKADYQESTVEEYEKGMKDLFEVFKRTAPFEDENRVQNIADKF